ncbi:MAG: amidohydrolase family protein [Acidimicrobiia bacterium]
MIADAVIHAYDLSPANRAAGATEEEYAQMQLALLGMHQLWSDPAYLCPPTAYVGPWDAEALASVVFLESDTDVAVYHDVALTAVLANGGTPVAVGAEMARALPGRVLLYGGVDATGGPAALDRLDELVEDYGVAGFKFYPVTGLFDGDGRAEGVLLDDPERMYPLLRRAEELGVRHIAMHKAVPFRREALHPYHNVHDVDAAAVAFPRLTFEVVHSGFAFLEETAFQLGRHPNVYANLEISMNLIVRWPRRFARILGTLMQMGGPGRILYGTGAMLTHPQPVIDAFRRFEMPADLVEEEGFPPVDDTVKDMILGGNLLHLHGLDPATLADRLADDEVAKFRAEHGRAPAWSRLPAGAVA